MKINAKKMLAFFAIIATVGLSAATPAHAEWYGYHHPYYGYGHYAYYNPYRPYYYRHAYYPVVYPGYVVAPAPVVYGAGAYYGPAVPIGFNVNVGIR